MSKNKYKSFSLPVFLVFLFFGTFSISTFRIAAQSNDTSFVRFWDTFHKDIIAKDYVALSKKTKFPLKAKGELDYDSIDKYSVKDFERVFSKFLSDEIATYRKVRYEWLKSYKLSSEKIKRNDLVRIENMVFEKIKGQWWLTLIYDGHSKY